ncbi:MAG: efflux RND transporter periplasmic adaptor subunit [bacterium]|nr:efflux RND transporter periplasmic adaptor subunit [bacterium]
MRRVIVYVLILGALGFGAWRWKESRAVAPTGYRLVEVTKGDLQSVVAATGNLQPVVTVQVGTQVSGIVDEVLVDFNDQVKAGQVVARIDKTLLIAAVQSSRAQLERAEAEQRHAEREHLRLSKLHEQEMISDSEFNTAQFNLETSRASVKSAKVDLERAERNLGYATITAPIDGTVVQRSIDPGQTVQASFAAPELFRIAGDLSQMQILVSVDESDIGQIKVGQAAKFTVQAWPDDTFTGTVRQVRLQSVTTENVVSYTAVVDVPNPDQRLLPGMTASVEFIVDQAQDVLQVANAALRYRPEQTVMQAIIERKRAAMQAQGGPGGPGGGAPADSARARGGQSGGAGGMGGTPATGGMPGAHGGAAGSGGLPANRGMLWFTDQDGKLDVMFVRTGITDGTNTEIRGREIQAGQQVIAGVTTGAAATPAASSSPFQQQRQSGPPRPGGF